jgi:hypothetical protein
MRGKENAMGRKQHEDAPLPVYGEGKLDEETRRTVYGGSGRDQGEGRREEEDKEGREFSGASDSGDGKRVGQVKKTKQ